MEEVSSIAKNIDKTFYITSKFFPKKVREDVARLYGFVGTVKMYADTKDNHKKVLALEKSYESAISNNSFDAIAHQWDDTDTRIIKHIVRLQHKYKFDTAWVASFFKSMKMDIDSKKYSSIDELLTYIYGSSETVGLMLAKILNLPEESIPAVQLQARAIKWADLLRSIGDDASNGRQYFPASELKKYGLKNLTEEEAKDNHKEYEKFIFSQIKQFRKWQNDADKGITYVPERYQVPIRTTISIYSWIIDEIEADPLMVFDKKLVPRKRQIIRKIIQNSAKGTARVTVRTTKQVKAGVKKVKPATKATIPKIKQAPSVAKEKAKELKDKYIEIEEEH